MASGTVKWFNPDKGFGFIESPGIDDVFVHASALPYGESLGEGDTVEFGIEQGPRGTNATDIVIVSRGEAPARSRTDSFGTRRAAGPTVDPMTLPLVNGVVLQLRSHQGLRFHPAR